MYTSKVNIGRDICEIKSSQCQILPTSLLPSIASGQWSTQRQRGKHVESTARDQESQQPSAPPTWSRNCDVKVGQGQGRLETTHDYLVFLFYHASSLYINRLITILHDNTFD